MKYGPWASILLCALIVIGNMTVADIAEASLPAPLLRTAAKGVDVLFRVEDYQLATPHSAVAAPNSSCTTFTVAKYKQLGDTGTFTLTSQLPFDWVLGTPSLDPTDYTKKKMAATVPQARPDNRYNVTLGPEQVFYGGKGDWGYQGMERRSCPLELIFIEGVLEEVQREEKKWFSYRVGTAGQTPDGLQS